MGRTHDGFAAGLRLPPLENGVAGDPGLFGPRSSIWRIGRERALLLGGPAALLLQVAHPLVAAGVSDHSDFRVRPYERLQATLAATLSITFGDTPQAEAAAARVAATHARVKGRLSRKVGPFAAGTPYDARNPELALWVHATLVETGLDTYARFVRPLPFRLRERYYEDAKPFAALFGAGEAVMPRSYGAFRAYFARMLESPVLTVGEEAKVLARHILNPPVPAPLRPALTMFKMTATDLLPPRLRRDFGLRWTARDRAVLGGFSRAARLALPLTPTALRYWPHYRTASRRTGVRDKG